ncbi:MAG: thioredoxin [Patescibacteria group bacterium]|nr:thioredoxin [Patescibacteria group bacterium]
MSEIELNDQNFEEEVLKEKDKPVLVDFWAQWCGPCKMQGPILEEMAEEIKDKAKITKIEIDKNPKIAEKFQIKSIPTLIIFKEGEAVWQGVGLQQKENLIEQLNKYI